MSECATPSADLVFQTAGAMSVPRVSSERILIERALAGDGRAYAALVEPHLGLLHRIAARACGDRALAEDAVQEALTIAYRQLARYQPDTSLRAFLAAIAVKQARTLLRGERRRRVREETSDRPESPAGPADLLEAERIAARVREVLAKLPKKRQQAALLRLDAGLSHAEIASAIGTTEGSARVLVHYALATLREELGDLL